MDQKCLPGPGVLPAGGSGRRHKAGQSTGQVLRGLRTLALQPPQPPVVRPHQEVDNSTHESLLRSEQIRRRAERYARLAVHRTVGQRPRTTGGEQGHSSGA